MEAQVAARPMVVLGEANHFIHQKVDFRVNWITQLAQHYKLVLAEEFGFSDAWRVNQYLQTGEESWLEKIPTLGFKDDDRQDRNDQPTGILKASADQYPSALLKAEQCRFYRVLRNLILQGAEISLHGVDINGSLGAGYADLVTLLDESTMHLIHEFGVNN